MSSCDDSLMLCSPNVPECMLLSKCSNNSLSTRNGSQSSETTDVHHDLSVSLWQINLTDNSTITTDRSHASSQYQCHLESARTTCSTDRSYSVPESIIVPERQTVLNANYYQQCDISSKSNKNYQLRVDSKPTKLTINVQDTIFSSKQGSSIDQVSAAFKPTDQLVLQEAQVNPKIKPVDNILLNNLVLQAKLQLNEILRLYSPTQQASKLTKSKLLAKISLLEVFKAKLEGKVGSIWKLKQQLNRSLNQPKTQIGSQTTNQSFQPLQGQNNPTNQTNLQPQISPHCAVSNRFSVDEYVIRAKQAYLDGVACIKGPCAQIFNQYRLLIKYPKQVVQSHSRQSTYRSVSSQLQRIVAVAKINSSINWRAIRQLESIERQLNTFSYRLQVQNELLRLTINQGCTFKETEPCYKWNHKTKRRSRRLNKMEHY